MKWILILIAWNGTLTIVPGDYPNRPDCETAGIGWQAAAKGKIGDARFVCMPR